MRIVIIPFIALLAALPAVSCAADASDLFPGFRYISDHKAFVSDLAHMSSEQKRALARGKKLLAEKLKKEIRGEFSISEAAWGLQIDFTAIETKHGDVWERETEGFGEIFLSKDLATSKIDYGP